MFAKEPLPGRELDIAVGRALGMEQPERELWYKPSEDIGQAVGALDELYEPWEIGHRYADSGIEWHHPEHWTCDIPEESVHVVSEVSLCHAICHAILETKEKGYKF